MSTLHTARSHDEQFDALVRTAFAPGRDAAVSAPLEELDFHEVFDLDYGSRVSVPQQRVSPEEDALVPAPRRTAEVTPRVVTRHVRPVRRSRVRLTRRGRVVAVLAFLGLGLALMVTMGGLAVASLGSGTPEQVRVVTVQPGDTLYDIAGDLAEPGEIRETVHRIQELNSLPGGMITEGQRLAVPRG